MKAVIPAAGRGDRWRPITQYIPKEMLPIGNKPAIHYVISELIESGIKQIAIVIRKQKEIIRDYVQDQFEGEADLVFFYQEIPQGMGDAVLRCKGYLDGGAFCLALPDALFFYERPLQKRLIDFFNKHKPMVAVGVAPVRNEDAHLYCGFEYTERETNLYILRNFCGPRYQNVKGQAQVLRGVGRYVMKQEVIRIWETINLQAKRSGELDDLLLFKELQKEESILGVRLDGENYDIGTFDGWAHANMRLMGGEE